MSDMAMHQTLCSIAASRDWDAPASTSSSSASAATSLASISSSTRRGSPSRPIERAIALIEAAFSQPVSLATLAETAGLSVSRFATLFRHEVGISPHRYVCLVRVRHAQRLLESGLPPSIVATEVGFFDQSHLGRHFRRTLGVTPRCYRRDQTAEGAALA